MTKRLTNEEIAHRRHGRIAWRARCALDDGGNVYPVPAVNVVDWSRWYTMLRRAGRHRVRVDEIEYRLPKERLIAGHLGVGVGRGEHRRHDNAVSAVDRIVDGAVRSWDDRLSRRVDRRFAMAIDHGHTFGWLDHNWIGLSRVTSAVIAIAMIDRVVSGFGDPTLHSDEIVALGDQRRWFFGPIGYVLRDVRALAEPVPCRGWQGFWTLPADVEAKVAAQLSEIA